MERQKTRSGRNKTLGTLLLLTAGSLLVQGYHPFAEDAEIYLPGVEKILHPELFPVGQEFFRSHASLTFFPNVFAFFLRISHLPMEWGLFLCHVASIFLLLLACWELSGLFFASPKARWGGVCMVAALLTIPVAGTALYIMDQYLNPRNLAAFAGVFAITRVIEKKYGSMLLWLLFAGSMHPLMWVFPFSFCALWLVLKFEKFDRSWKNSTGLTLAGLLWPWISLAPNPSLAYREVARLHGYFYIKNWKWYELLGLFGPLILFWCLGRLARRRQSASSSLHCACRALVLYGLIYVVVALVVDLPQRFEALARLQPLRCLHLLYIVLFVMIGGWLGECVLRERVWRWLLLFVPLSLGMVVAQRSLFPASSHVEWPGSAPRNPWAQAFIWIRQNTPVNAVFALDPDYMHVAGEDEIGFRGLAERSRLADLVKDNGVVSMFPPLAEEWWEQVQAQSPWNSFRSEDFLRLKGKYGASWVVLQPSVAGLDCKYRNAAVQVCRIP